VPSEEKEPDEVSPPSIEALSQLLERIDVTTSGLEGGMAHEAMAAVWEQRPDYREFVTFNDDYWNELTAETAFIARSFNDYCIATGDDQLLEQKIPEGKKLAITIKKYLDHLIRAREEIAKLDNLTEEQEGEYEDLEFIVQQLLRIALTLDYSDEIGRRNLFNIMREALALPELPEECTSLAAQLLRRVCQGSGEKEFISVMKEAMDQVKISFSDEKDGDDEDEESDEDSFHSAESDIEELSGDDAHASGKKKNRRRGAEEEEGNEHKELLVYAKCMHLAECLLQNVDCELESSTPLVDLLNRLIIPAFKVNHNVIQEMGFRGLGLAILRSRVSN
jgi:condensin complex subunit 3